MQTVRGTARKIGADFLKAGGIATAALTGVGVMAVNRFATVDKSVREVVTLMDDAGANTIPKLTDEVMKMSAAFGQSKENIAGARYQIVSAGFRSVADSGRVLADTMKLATAGIADAGQSANLMTSILNTYHLTASQSTRVSDVLFQTVKYGQTTIRELVGQFGEMLPAAKAAGVGLEELGAMMATTTSRGMDTAMSSTAIKQAILSLVAATPLAAKEMARLGIQTKDSTGKMLPLLDVIRQFRGMPLDVVRRIIPEIRAANAVLTLADNFDTLKSNLEGMNSAAGATQAAFETMATSPAMKIQQLKQKIDNMVVSLGKALIPVMNQVVSSVEPVITGLTDWIKAHGDLVAKILKFSTIGAGFVTVVGGVSLALSMLMSPITLVVGAVAGIGYAVYKAITAWDDFKAALSSVGNFVVAIGKTIMGSIDYAVYYIMQKVLEGLNWIAEKLDVFGLRSKLGIQQVSDAILGGVKSMTEQSRQMMNEGLATITQAWQSGKDTAAGIFDEITGFIQAFRGSTEVETAAYGASVTENIGLKTQSAVNIAQRSLTSLDAYVAKHSKAIDLSLRKTSNNSRASLNILAGAARSVGTAIGQAFGHGAQGAKAALKQILNSVITAVEGIILAAKAAALAEGVLSFGLTLFKDLAGITAATAVLEGARAIVNSFHSGGIVGSLAGSAQEVPAILLTGESVLNRSATQFLGKKTIDDLNAGRYGNASVNIALNNDFNITNQSARGVSRSVENEVYNALMNLERRGKINNVTN